MGFAECFRAAAAEIEPTMPGRVGLAAWNLDERDAVTVDAGRVVDAASTIKTLIMITALRRVRDGRLDLGDARELPAADERAAGFGVLRELTSLHRLSLADLVTLMIVISDNAATNEVIDAVGLAAINACARDLGCEATHIGRKLMHTQDRGRNVTTALDQARVLDRLARGAALPAGLTRYALDVLSRQQVRDRLPALLPDAAGCWNKTGELRGLRHDVGLVGTDRPRAVVAVLVDQLDDDRSTGSSRGGPACEAIARCGEAAYRALDHGGRS